MTKIKAEISEIVNRERIKKTSKTNTWFFKISKIDKPLARLEVKTKEKKNTNFHCGDEREHHSRTLKG